MRIDRINLNGPLERKKENRFLDEEKKRMREIIQDVIDDKWGVFDANTMAYYDADFSTEYPWFINMRSEEGGRGFGYIAFHDFLRRVGVGKEFTSSDFTSDGEKLFAKAVSDGLIQQTSKPFGLQRTTLWKVVGDPIENLKRIKNSWE